MAATLDVDYLWNQPTIHSSQLGINWSTALGQLGSNAQRAGLLYVHFGHWPPWVWVLAQVAAAQAAAISFYFIGDPLPLDLAEHCPKNCHWLPLNSLGLLDRLESLLNVPRATVSGIVDANGDPLGGYFGTRKLCDLKPLWPALLPELTSRHEWIGYADDDIVFGHLASEVAHLGQEDELLVPAAFYPEPLANGNFLLMRANDKMVNAYRRGAWRRMLRSPVYMRFDEWGGELDRFDPNASMASTRRVTSEGGFDLHGEGSATMRAVYLEMMLSGQLCARPTRRLLVQDNIVQRGRHSEMSKWPSWRGHSGPRLCGLISMHLKAWGCPPHSGKATHHLRFHREAVALEPEAAQVDKSTPSGSRSRHNFASGHFPGLNFRATTEVRWKRDGSLIAERHGPCICPNDIVAQYGLSMCSQCLRNPGENLMQVTTHRRLEVLGFHFLSWKKVWRSREHAVRKKHNGTRPNTSEVRYPVPMPCPASQGFILRETVGFVCDADTSRRLRPLHRGWKRETGT